MKTLSAIAASQTKVRLAAFVIACAGVFLFVGCPLEHLLFRPLSNEVISVLLQSAVLALFALGALTAPGRKSRWRAGWELLFILGIMLGWISSRNIPIPGSNSCCCSRASAVSSGNSAARRCVRWCFS